ncbi:MAG TPA: hypothetical protein VG605_24420 [Puia sp.]|nr:hypothetical protein [Puia sp.]
MRSAGGTGGGTGEFPARWWRGWSDGGGAVRADGRLDAAGVVERVGSGAGWRGGGGRWDADVGLRGAAAPGQFHSPRTWATGMFISSRYLATVRRAME